MGQITLVIDTDDQNGMVALAGMLQNMIGNPQPIREMRHAGPEGVAVGNDGGDEFPIADTTDTQDAPVTTTPPPPPPPPAITEEAATTVTMVTTEVTTDEDGLPWDARIHASTKTMTQKGLWKKKRGVDDDVIKQVEAELHQLMNVPRIEISTTATETTGEVPPPPSAASVEPPAPPANTGMTDLGSAGAATTASLSDVPPPPSANVAMEPMTFAEFLRSVSERIASRKINQAMVNDIIQRHGVPSMPLMANRPDLIDAVWADIVAAEQQ